MADNATQNPQNTATRNTRHGAQVDPRAFLNRFLSQAENQEERADLLREIQRYFIDLSELVIAVVGIAQKIIEKEGIWKYLRPQVNDIKIIVQEIIEKEDLWGYLSFDVWTDLWEYLCCDVWTVWEQIIARNQPKATGEVQVTPRVFLNQLLLNIENQQHRVELLFENQIRFGRLSHQIDEAITIVQEIIENEEPWKYLGIDRETMWEQILYVDVVKPAIDRSREAGARSQRLLDMIEAAWGSGWRSVIDPEGLMSGRESEWMLIAFGRLSQRLEANVTSELLAKAIKNELDKSKI